MFSPLECCLFSFYTLRVSCLVHRSSEVAYYNWFALLKVCSKTRTEAIELMLLSSVAIVTTKRCPAYFYWLLDPLWHTPPVSLLCGGVIMPGISGLLEGQHLAESWAQIYQDAKYKHLQGRL